MSIDVVIQQLIDAGWTEAPDCAPDHYPHESDCQKFYQCDHGYRSPDRVCSEGSLWHNALKNCDHPANTDCPFYSPALGGDLARVLFRMFDLPLIQTVDFDPFVTYESLEQYSCGPISLILKNDM